MHEHPVPQQNINRSFKIGILINFIFVIIEGLVGLSANSLSLVADAGHNLSDVLGLLVAWIALILSQRARNNYRTYGFKRSSILAALFNAVFLLVAVGGILLEAVQRLLNLQPVQENSVMIVAAIGIVINGFTAFLFMKDQHHDLNVKGAFLHMAADTLVSVGVVVAALVIKFTAWYWLDPVISIGIAIIIFIGTWQLLRDSLDLSLDAVPKNIDLTAVEKFILAQPTVKDFHDLHVWAMSTTENAMTVHICRTTLADNNQFLADLDQALQENFDLDHITMQVELGKIPHESVSRSI